MGNGNLLENQERRDEDTQWKEKSCSELIDHIVSKHHEYLHTELPALSPYVSKIHHVHGAVHVELFHVQTLFQQIKTELEQHSLIEETEVFPIIKAWERTPSATNADKLTQLLAELENDHENVGLLLRELRSVTRDFSLPPNACMTYRMTYQRLEELEADLLEHIHLETDILFPKAIAELSR